MREMYEFGSSSSSSDGGGYYSDDHYNFQAMEYIEWPPAFRDGTVTLAVDSSPNLQEDQKNIQAKISSHHLYPMLLLSHIDCHKVGAPPEIVNMLDNIVQENDLYRKSSSSSNTSLNQLMVTDDSELDEFMATYCDVLAQFKSDLTMCFNESATFLNNVQSQLTNLCTTTNISEKGAEAVAEVEAEESDTNGGGEANNENELKVSSTSDEMCRRRSEMKDKLMRKYSGYITSLKHNFCKKNNKGKLPREATKILFNWWNTHYNWPYPTEVDKVFLAESTGLDPKQINNWFINQRKRHWKPSENMQFAVMETIHVANVSCKSRENNVAIIDLLPKFTQLMESLSEFIPENKDATYAMDMNSPHIYGLAKCHNDLSQDDCKLCFMEAKDQLAQCIPSPGGFVYLDGCFLRYENYNFFDETIEKNSSIFVCGDPTDITNDQYMKRDFAARVDRSIANVTSMSIVNNGFGATVVKSGLLAIYALGQCWDYFSSEACTKCLNHAGDMLRKCLPAAEGKAMNAGCYLRYSSNKFFDDGALVIADKGPKKGVNVWLIAAIALLSVLALFAIIGAYVGYRRFSKEKGGSKRVHKLPPTYETSKLNFKYELLEKATGGFDPLNKLGQGGSGSVYKGTLPDGKNIAVKRLLYNTRQWAEEFFNEVNLISGIQHKNVVKLLGCSIEGPESLLVFDHVSHRNLDQLLFDKNKRQFLGWKQRFEIILGIAEGLAYLHEGSKAKIIHRDIKNSNILVDDELVPKISDFGLARRFAPHKTHVSTGVAGTLGYLAPEYLLQGCLTEKADVYSFGVVAIEVACCIKSNAFVSDSASVLQSVWRNYKLNKITDSIDSRLMIDFEEQEASRVLQLGLLCTQTRRFSRPSMSEVVTILRNEETVIPVPMQPPFQNSSLLAPPDTPSSSSINKDSFGSEWYSTDGISIHSSEFTSQSSSQSGEFSTSENSRLLKNS